MTTVTMREAAHGERQLIGTDEGELVTTARITGLLYLAMCVTAVFGHFIIPGKIFDAANAVATLTHLAERPMLARLGIAMELGTAALQVLLALWFYRLFRSVDGFAAVCTMVLGLFNAVAQLASAAMLATALDVAFEPSLGGAATPAQLMYVASGNLWQVAEVFFGLWLVPMGLLVLRSGWMPRLLGYLLMAGGVGYVLHAFLPYLAPEATSLAAVLVAPSLSEFWMAGYLLVVGIRPPHRRPVPRATERPPITNRAYAFLRRPISVVAVLVVATILSLADRNFGYFFGIGVVFFIAWKSGWNWSAFGFARRITARTVLTAIGLTVPLFVGLSVIEFFLQEYFGAFDLSSVENIRGDFGSYAIMMGIMWVFAAFGEELLFRGFYMKRFAELFGNSNAAWLSSALLVSVYFGVSHLYQGTAGVIAVAIGGLYFSMVFYGNRDNLALAALVHGFYDTIGLTLIYMNRDGLISDWLGRLVHG